MKKIIKNNLKIIIAFTLGIVIAGTTAYAANILFYSTDVGYDNSNGMAATTVQGAIDELYNLANNKECKSGYIKQNETSTGYECAPPPPKCIRAETLHTSNRKTWGTLGSGDTIAAGDAFDCDVNGDGTYNAATERFYYVSDYYNTTTKEFEDDTAVLIYYNNVAAGVPSNSALFAYDSSKENFHGPVTALAQLPTTTQWSNVSLKNTSRQILTQTGTTSTDGGSLPVFSYAGYAARLLTTQELESACKITVGSYMAGELDTCAYLMENTCYDSSSIGNNGYWLESPVASYSNRAWGAFGFNRYVNYLSVGNDGGVGARPVIEVLTSDISK